ncbi:MAG: T9SS type A sorting domain-containing protein, partial [Chlorobiales bacterium]|nr:T9SS type A sorting domain-containing protein [Chlorobiales bacterium]
STSFESPIAPLKMGESSTDIKQPTASKLMVYPNPVNKGQQITVNVPKEQAGSILRITIYNINGQVMKQYSVNDLSSGTTGVSVNVPALNPGIYILVIEGNNSRQKAKLVVR